jgi:hypothetical protein
MSQSRGIHYIALGEKYKKEAIQSASRVSELVEYPLSIVTDSQSERISELFDDINIIEDSRMYKKNRYGGKVKPIFFAESPYQQTLYLDTDTYVVTRNAISEIFEVLNEYELAAAFDTHRNIDYQYTNQTTPEEKSPESFPWLNTGVVAYRNNSNTHMLFNKWEKIFDRQSQIIGGVNDQSSFTEALFSSNINHTVLPVEYNHRTPFLQDLRGEVKILHGHHNNLSEVAEYINKPINHPAGKKFQAFNHLTHTENGEDVALPIRLSPAIYRTPQIYQQRIKSNFQIIQDSLEQRGIFGTMSKIYQKITSN